MSTIKITANPVGKVSRPLLIHVNKINFKSKQQSECILYYRIPFTYDYYSAQKLKDSDLFLPDSQIFFKIVNYVNKTEQIVDDRSEIDINKNQIKLTNKTKDGVIQVQGVILNQAKQSDVFADISLKEISGYQKYYEYRKKYKTLENITRKIDFSIDHRLKLLCQKPNSKEQFFFSLDQLKDKEMKNWYIQLVQKTRISFYFQQIISIGDTNLEKTIEEGSLDLGVISWEDSYDLVLQMSQYLKIRFNLKMVKNKNLSKFQFVALRVLQTSQSGQTLRIGDEETIKSSSGAIELNPLVEGRYYDLQYGYLNENLKEFRKMGQQQQLHKHLQRLTSSREKYQHFMNQKVLDLSGSKSLMFSINNDVIQIPVTYLLEGYNCFQNKNWKVKFLLEVENSPQALRQKTTTQSQYQKFQPIPRKLYKLDIKDLLNIGQIPSIMQKHLFSNEGSFFLKIKSERTIYTIEFEISIVKKTQFKNEAKQLELKTQFSKFLDGKFLLVTETDNNKQKLLMLKSCNLQPFYLLQLTDTTPVSFDISTKKHLIMHGQIKKQYFYNSGTSFLTKIILSPNGYGNNNQKSVICAAFQEIDQKIEGSSFNFKIKYNLSAMKPSISESVYYDLEIVRVRQEETKRKKRRFEKDKISDKVQLQVLDQNSASHRIKEFSTNRSCFVQRTPNLHLTIKLKKMHYDVDLNVFDNTALIQKSLLLNRNVKDTLKEGTLTSELPAHHFRQYEFQAYDELIKQKVTLKIEIYCFKQPFSIGQQHTYRFKVPHLLWKMNSIVQKNEPQPRIEIQTFLSSKKHKNETKQLFFNSAQQVSLPHFNYSDGISVKIKHQNGYKDIGYSKIRQSIMARCEVVKDVIGWIDEGEWYFGILSLAKSSFYFLIKMQFDVNAQRHSSNSSRATQKTKSKQKKQTSNQKGGPDIFAKTLKNLDVVSKLKMSKNNFEEQLKQLTSKYVQKQQMVAYLKKKIVTIEEQNRRKKEEMQSALQSSVKKPKSKVNKDEKGKPSLYRSICQCGQRNPPFMGYCKNCLQKLRQRYEIFFKQYQQKSADYEKTMFKKFNLRDKIQTMKQKIKSYKTSMSGDGGIIQNASGQGSTQHTYQRMEEKQLTVQIQELKLEVFDLQRQRESQFERRAYQMDELEKRIKKQDSDLWEKSQQLNALHLKLNEVKQQIKQNQKDQEKETYN